MVTPARRDVLAELRSLASGAQKHMKTGRYTITNRPYTGGQIARRVQVSVDAAVRVQEARAALADALANEMAVKKAEADFLRGLRIVIQGAFCNSSETLAEFALEPRKKRRPLTAEESVLAAAKLRATRAERRTMGKRQRARITGDVTGVVISPATADGTNQGGEGKTGG
jgi:hypothetical protein